MSKAAGSVGRAGRTRSGSRAAAKRKRAATGLETAADGAVIGRDPRRLSPEDLRGLGHRGKPLLQAMRRRCVDCCAGKVDEVRRCTATACPLWPYRMGTDPWRAEGSRAKPMLRPAEGKLPSPAAVAAPKPVAPADPAPVAATPAPAVELAPERPLATTRRRQRSASATPFLPFLDDAPA